jgi:protein-S-isoprenylcysteine O-methyltransferase Ste14
MLWLIILVLFWGFLHSLLASKKAKELARRWLGDQSMRFYRLGYNVFACVCFLPVLAALLLIPDHILYLVPLPWSLLLIAGELLAFVALLVAFLQADIREFLGIGQLGESPRPSQLTTAGLYRYVRHPLYTAGLVFIWLMPLMTFNILAVNIALTVYVIIGAYIEERKLRREFKQVYVDYMAVTPMFIPFLKGNKSPHGSS